MYSKHRHTNNLRWAPALLSPFHAGEREAKKKSARAKKSEIAEHERKKREFALFPPTRNENPVSEPKATQRGERRVLSEMYSSVC
jgi:hypothetical protein